MLQEHREPIMTFTPLQDIRPKPVSDHLRHRLGGSARLAVGLLQYGPRLERAFMQYCG